MIPKTLDEAVNFLLAIPNHLIVAETTEKEFLAVTHHTIGRKIRNEWVFSDDQNSLVSFFSDLGVLHADDISAIILTTFYRKYHHLPVDLEDQVQRVKDFWGEDTGYIRKYPRTTAECFVDKHEGIQGIVEQPSQQPANKWFQVWEIMNSSDDWSEVVRQLDEKFVIGLRAAGQTIQNNCIIWPKRVALQYSTPEQLNQFRYDKEV